MVVKEWKLMSTLYATAPSVAGRDQHDLRLQYIFEQRKLPIKFRNEKLTHRYKNHEE